MTQQESSRSSESKTVKFDDSILDILRKNDDVISEDIEHLKQIERLSEKKENKSPMSILKHLKREEHKENTTWESCCFRVDRRMFMFIVQLIISLLVIIFSMIQLVFNDGSCFYESLLTLVIGYWIRAPRIDK